MKTKGFKSYPCKTYDAILHVTAYREGSLEGYLTHPRMETPRRVENVPQLLFLLNELLSDEELLLSFPGADAVGKTDLQQIATLRLQILFREHHTWQGCVHWEEQSNTFPFHSVLELICILDEILTD
ncbi:MAG: hypothetical protein IKU58_04235 [Clostridia bacterium]|nr:hypothetical protein [Clostridia bacterium]